jgi:hypothetical protein
LKEKTELWEKSSLFNAGFYTTNMLKYGANRGALTAEGIYILEIAGTATALHPFFVPDDTGIFVELLVRAPPKQDLLGVSEMANYETYLKAWSAVTGVPGELKEISVDDFDRKTPGGLGREVGQSSASSAEFGWGDHLGMPKNVSILMDAKSTWLTTRSLILNSRRLVYESTWKKRIGPSFWKALELQRSNN